LVRGERWAFLAVAGGEPITPFDPIVLPFEGDAGVVEHDETPTDFDGQV
jgi:hypothetical protein